MVMVTVVGCIQCFLLWVLFFGADAKECDRHLAENIASQLQAAYETEYALYVDDGTVTSSAAELCLNTMQTNDNQKRYNRATFSCEEEEIREVKLKWNSTTIDIINFCRYVCPGYEQLLMCAEGVEIKAAQGNQFEKFCSSFNSSLQCAMVVLRHCHFDQTFFYKLVNKYAKDLWNNMCLSGCSNLDVSVNDCWDYVSNLMTSRNMTDKCRWFMIVEECLANHTNKCQQTEDLLAFQYPSYRSIGKLCLATTTGSHITTEERIVAPTANEVIDTTTAVVPEETAPDTQAVNVTYPGMHDSTIQTVYKNPDDKYYTVVNDSHVYGEKKLTSADDSGPVESKHVETSHSYYPVHMFYYSMSALVIACIALIGVICLVCVHLQNRHHRTWHTGEPRPDIEIEATKESAMNEENGRN